MAARLPDVQRLGEESEEEGEAEGGHGGRETHETGSEESDGLSAHEEEDGEDVAAEGGEEDDALDAVLLVVNRGGDFGRADGAGEVAQVLVV